MADAVGFDEVLKTELEELRHRRSELFGSPHSDATGGPVDQAYCFNAFGVSFSGGGIRSATFNLGVVQGLAARGLLPHIDYLSTVSGGGYIGTWLHSVIRRKYDGDPRHAGENLNPRIPGQPEEDPVAFLRKYSNYLAPQLGLFSADFWVILTIWLRNMTLNQLILIPFLASVMAACILVASFLMPAALGWWGALIVAVATFILLIGAVLNAGSNLRGIVAHQFPQARIRTSTKPKPAWPTVLGLLLAGLTIFRLHWVPFTPLPLIGDLIPPAWLIILVSLWLLHFALQWTGGFPQCYDVRHTFKALVLFHQLWMPALAGAVTAAGLCGLLWILGSLENEWHTVIWGPPLIVFAIIKGVSFHMGLMGSDFPDASREWLARVGAVASVNCFAWSALLGIAVYGPFGMAWLGLNYGAVAVAAIVGWIGSTTLGVGAGTSPSTSGHPQQKSSGGFKDKLTQAAPAIFMIGLLILIAGCVHFTLGALTTGFYSHDLPHTTHMAVQTPSGKAAMFAPLFQGLVPFASNYRAVLDDPATRQRCLWLLAILGGVTLLLPLRFNINEFSMHHFYKNRLVRCYLGAGNGQGRDPNRFTGFDPRDDIPIEKLRAQAEKPYYGPYPIVNTALNLNTGSELAKQERKADSFIFTPRFCGFNPPHSKDDLEESARPGSRLFVEGYRPTANYFDKSGPDIGTAMAISGAAANPNWGYHTSPSVAFLLTLFNVRLGWWLGNPRIKCSTVPIFRNLCPPERPGPLYGLLWLIWELLGQTTGRSKYVNLSDGGHFENLGLYELVRRRCRYIIVGDAEEDPELTFYSLGGAIRRCRADFGVEIDIDIQQIKAGLAERHCVVGTIIYPEDDPQPQLPLTPGGPTPPDSRARGWILYLKSSITGDEPEDVKQYQAEHPIFPQESTLNQFFTESQFESYRRLGLHVLQTAFENISTDALQNDPRELPKMFQSLAGLWYTQSNLAPGVAIKHADAYSSLMKRLAGDPNLAFLDHEVTVGSRPPLPRPTDEAALRQAFFFVVDLIQLTENVWSDFRFESAGNRNNPANGGWVTVMRAWARSPFIGEVWDQVKSNYNLLFQTFFEELRRP